MNNAHDYIEQVKKEQTILTTIQSKDIDIPKLAKKTLEKRSSTMDMIEKVIFTYLAYIIDK